MGIFFQKIGILVFVLVLQQPDALSHGSQELTSALILAFFWAIRSLQLNRGTLYS
jgi:hypothetical protein